MTANLPVNLPVSAVTADLSRLPVGGAAVTAGMSTTPAPGSSTSRQITLKSQQPSSEESKFFERFREHLDVFQVEVYRCKLCKFYSAIKLVMLQHMTEKHFPVSGKETTVDKPKSRDDRVSTATVGDGSTWLPVTAKTQVLSQQFSTTARTCGTLPNAVATVLNVGPSLNSASGCATHASSRALTQVTDAGEQIRVTSEVNPESTEGNALELLMGIGNREQDMGLLKSPKTSAVSQTSARSDLGQEAITESDNQSVALTGTVGLMATLGTGQSKTEGLVTVNEEELAKTLQIDEKKDEEGESGDDDDGADDEDDSNTTQGNPEDLSSGATLLKPIPISIGLGTVGPTFDVQEIADTASKSNPKATTITVLHHGQGNEPPTAIQFKKSRKSKAVIPTGESLGIASPFISRAYKGTKLFLCTTCHARYKSLAELERHVKKKHQRDRKFLCEICGEALATRASVKYHVSKKHMLVRQLFNCNVCDYSTRYRARMAIHQATHQSQFFCNLCKKSYVSEERLKRHYSSPLHKNALNPLVCEHCGYSTKKRDNFLVHMRKHTGEKPYKCKMCNYASADGSTLKVKELV